ncbi:MAG: IS110 family transposase [Rhodobacteraceae bacterium]|nr:IS110 family transposase [Paracoccaceae bacterium]MBR9820240.1 IS110 family transposase [Paracoccaceae bacterium]
MKTDRIDAELIARCMVSRPEAGRELDAQISAIERRIENVIAQTEPRAAKANLFRSIPGIGPVSAAMLIAELPEPAHNPVPKPVAKRVNKRGKPHKLVSLAIARRLVTIANAIIKTGKPWQSQPDR